MRGTSAPARGQAHVKLMSVGRGLGTSNKILQMGDARVTKKGSEPRGPRAKGLRGRKHSPRRHIPGSLPESYLLESHPELGSFPGDAKLGNSELGPEREVRQDWRRNAIR
jgi:hypothetical protein